jgi:Tfp pilus assembly protein PilO
VSIRRFTAKPVVAREYHYDMPFELQADGPYFNLLDFFSRLSRLSRIINVGDIDFEDAQGQKKANYPIRPGTSVTGVFTATTFFTKPADTGAAAKPATAGRP